MARSLRSLPGLTLRFPPHRREFKAFELEARRHGTADQRPVAERFRGLPGAGRHCYLGHFVIMDVAAEPDDFFLRAVDDFQLQRRAGVPMPDLHGVDTVPVRALALRQ